MAAAEQREGRHRHPSLGVHVLVEFIVVSQQHISKIFRDWGKGQRPVEVVDLNIGGFHPGEGQVGRLVWPHSATEWKPDVPPAIALAVADADAWFVDATRPDVARRLAAEIERALVEIKARA